MIRVNWILSIILSIILSVVATVVVNSIGFDWLRDLDWPSLKAIARKSDDSISVGFILDGVDRGNWEYLNEMIINDEYCLFATANYQDTE